MQGKTVRKEGAPVDGAENVLDPGRRSHGSGHGETPDRAARLGYRPRGEETAKGLLGAGEWSAGRYVAQIAFLVVIVGGATLRNLAAEGYQVPFFMPELHGICPIGAVQSLGRLITDAGYLFDPSRGHLWVLAGVLLVSLLMGAAFCGRLCPLGTVQEWIGKLGRRLLKSRYGRRGRAWRGRAWRGRAWLGRAWLGRAWLGRAWLGRAWLGRSVASRYAGLIRYGAFAFVLAAGAGWIAFELDLINPSVALVHMWTAAVPVTGALVFFGVLGASLVVERPWCRFLCPYGVLQTNAARVSPWTIRRSPAACNGCRECDRRCPLGVAVSRTVAVRDDRCTRCGVCVAACPIPGALSYSAPRGRAPIRSGLVASVAVLVLLVTPIVLASGIGLYGTSPDAQVSAEFDPETISPMMSLEELAAAAGVAELELLALLGLPPDYDTAVYLFDIEEDQEHEHITVGFIRETLSDRLSD